MGHKSNLKLTSPSPCGVAPRCRTVESGALQGNSVDPYGGSNVENASFNRDPEDIPDRQALGRPVRNVQRGARLAHCARSPPPRIVIVQSSERTRQYALPFGVRSLAP